MPGLGLKNIAQGIGTKARNQIQLGKKMNVGRKINNSIQTVNNGIQALTPLEKIPIIGTGVKVLTGVSGASAKMSQFGQIVLIKGMMQDQVIHSNDQPSCHVTKNHLNSSFK